jgi:ribosomal protein S18 acetylase RimI-like enzyme
MPTNLIPREWVTARLTVHNSTLDDVVAQLETYTQIRLYAHLKNWPALRFWTRAGYDKIVRIDGDKVDFDEADAYVMLERSLVEGEGSG